MNKRNSAIPNLLSFSAVAAISLISYFAAYDIFFVADDFWWLERAKFQIAKGPLTIFKSEGLYFDPLVYLFFKVNYIFGGLDSTWYHYVDFFVHTSNALLVSYLALLLTNNTAAAFFSGLIFSVSPVNADAVLWSSSRVDTLAALFYLSSIVLYIHYRNSRKLAFYLLSILSFIISLSVKITPVILPAIILTLELTSDKKDIYKGILLKVIPFLLISLLYIFMLSYASSAVSQSTGISNGLNTKEFIRAISVLFFPESLVAAREQFYMRLAIIFLIFLVGFSIRFISLKNSILLFIMIMAITLPLLFLRLSFVYATPANPPFYVLGSVSHRLYLAVISLSILMGSMLTFLLNRLEKYGILHTITLGLLIIGIIIYGNTYIAEKKQLWWFNGEEYRGFVDKITRFETRNNALQEASKLYLIGTRGQRDGIMQSMFRIYSENSDLILKSVRDYTLIPDIRGATDKVAVLALNKNGDFINVTQDIIRYQEAAKGNEM